MTRLRGSAPWLALALLLAVATGVGALCIEGGYRLYLWRTLSAAADIDREPAEQATFDAYSKPEPWRYAPAGGFEFNEGHWMLTTLSKGAFQNCRFFGEGNRYGGFGKVAEDWSGAELRVLLLGSSYTLTNENDQGVGEILRRTLTDALGRRVSLINLSRDSTGVLSMFDIAADKIPALEPDLVLFTFNTSAFGYRRHWREVRRISADTEALFLLKNPEPDAPRTRAMPQGAIVSPLATPEWCREMLRARADGDERRLRDDPTVHSLVAAYARFLASAAPPPVVLDFFRGDVSFVWNGLRHRDPFHGMTIREEVGIFTPLTIQDYRDDASFMAALGRVQASGVPHLLLHVPALPEMQDGQDYAFGRFGVLENVERALSVNLEQLTGHKVDHLLRRYGPAELSRPLALVVSEKDWHPSAAGERALAEALAQSVLEQLRAQPPTRWKRERS